MTASLCSASGSGKKRKWNIHTRSFEVMEEDEAETQRTFFPKESANLYHISKED